MLEQELGEAVVRQALENLGREQCDEILNALPISWVPHTTFEALYLECMRLSGRDLVTVHTEIVRRGVEHRVRNLWKILVRLSGANALMARSPMIYEKSYSIGKMRVAQLGPGDASIVIDEWPDMPEMAIRGVRVGTHTLLTLAGFKNVQVVSKSLPGGAEIRASTTA
jgi:hypothetical protein